MIDPLGIRFAAETLRHAAVGLSAAVIFSAACNLVIVAIFLVALKRHR